jgi:hypothetical protein
MAFSATGSGGIAGEALLGTLNVSKVQGENKISEQRSENTRQKLSENILEQRGLFWWGDETIPEDQFAPDNCVAGTLTIDLDGTASLDLDGYLSGELGPMQVFADQNKSLPPDKVIQGKLKGSKQNNALLFNLRKISSNFSSHGMSHERYLANASLVSQGSFAAGDQPLRFDSLNIELNGMEQWLGLGNIHVTRSRKRVTVKYSEPEDDVFTLVDGTLTMSFEPTGVWPASKRITYREAGLNLAEQAVLCYRPTQARALDDMIEVYGRIQELFILLTGSEYAIEWPWLTVGNVPHQLYFRTHPRSSKERPLANECWTKYSQLRPCFGELFDTWRRKRDELGPGIYLYLGLRRGLKMFVEHRFVNLIWGLESLHRRRPSNGASVAKIEKKIERILSQVKAAGDRHWLESRLKNAAEPSLKERLIDIFLKLPMDFEAKALDIFCSECASRRNDVSHFGGLRSSGSYTDFIVDLDKKSSALKILYHAALLVEMGVSPEIVKAHLTRSPAEFYLRAVCLVAQAVPRSVITASGLISPPPPN